MCGCCVPDSGTAVAPSLLQNHWEIFTDRRGGKKVLHLGVREGGREGGCEGGRGEEQNKRRRWKKTEKKGGEEMLTVSSYTHTL